MTVLQNLPLELQRLIVELLDPIALISLSQCSGSFRQFINPQRLHFIERLLALECLPAYGGDKPIVRSRSSLVAPDWTHGGWTDSRWACCGCLRLLPHIRFENHYIMGLEYRKPIPGSPAARRLTSWNSSRRGMHWGRRYYQMLDKSHDTEDRLSWRTRQIYTVCTTSGVETDEQDRESSELLHAFHSMGFEEFDNSGRLLDGTMDAVATGHLFEGTAHYIKLQHCGFKRRLRKCLECRFRGGEFKSHSIHHNQTRGISKVPIIPSRQVIYPISLDRFFPGFSGVLDSRRPTFNATINTLGYRAGDREDTWTLRMIRCPYCTEWQEARAFRFAGGHHNWVPQPAHARLQETWDDQDITETLINQLRCNACFAREHGRKSLEIQLLQQFNCLLDYQLLTHKLHMGRGYYFVKNCFKPNGALWSINEVQRLLQDASHAAETEAGDVFGYQDAAMLVQFYSRISDIWKLFIEDETSPGPEGFEGYDVFEGFRIWQEDFKEHEAHWRWLKSCQSEIRERPGLLVDLALSWDHSDVHGGREAYSKVS